MLSPPNRYEVNLLNDVLNIDFGQGAAKIPVVKVGLRKKYLPIGPVRTHCICLGIKAQSFWKTFNICNLGSKYPYFNRAYVVSGGFEWTHLYIFSWIWKSKLTNNCFAITSVVTNPLSECRYSLIYTKNCLISRSIVVAMQLHTSFATKIISLRGQGFGVLSSKIDKQEYHNRNNLSTGVLF